MDTYEMSETSKLTLDPDIEHGNSNYNEELNNIKFNRFNKSFIKMTIFIIIVSLLLYVFKYYKIYDKIYNSDITMFNFSLPNNNILVGSISSIDFNYTNYIPSDNCNDYLYGCCEIYDSCGVEGEGFTTMSIKIDPRVIHKHDIAGTNCPRFVELLDNYEKYYKNNYRSDCSNSDFGCCELNYECDLREYSRNYYNETDYIAILLYESNIKHNYVSKSTGISKIDILGSNCPHHYNIISEYEAGNLNENNTTNDDYNIHLTYIIIIAFLIYMLKDKICINSVYKKDTHKINKKINTQK